MKAPHQLKSKTTSFRLDTDLKKPVNEWLTDNPGFKLSSLINVAVRKFISEKQTLSPVVTVKASGKKVSLVTKKMMKKHSDMLDKLK